MPTPLKSRRHPCHAKDHTVFVVDQQEEEAVRLYVSIFPDSEIRNITRYGDAGPGPKGSVMTIGSSWLASSLRH
jgi:predicted 3-demethylubiquinone-9 3-methyltransferase (glyoxalase superfamily)